MCRICLEEGGGHFCSCTGTCGLVHPECLQKWIDISGRDTCEICLSKYQFPQIFRPRFNVKISDLQLSSNLNHAAICGVFGCTLFITNFVFAIIFGNFTANILTSDIISILFVTFSIPFTNSLQVFFFLSLLVCMSNALAVNKIFSPFDLDLYVYFSQWALTMVLMCTWFTRILWRSSWIVSTISI